MMTQNKGLVILVEDNKDNQDTFRRNFDATGLNQELDLTIFGSVIEFVDFGKTVEFSRNVRVLVFDLANNAQEENTGGSEQEFAISQYIRENYNHNRVPIIIHSGYIHKFNEFNHSGTVFKEERSGESVEKIVQLIELLYRTGFLDVFRQGGYLEQRHPNDLHRVFTSQFRDSELPDLLKLLQDCHGADCQSRVNDVFQRLSLRALINELTAPKADGTGQADNPKVNVVEHFYRRTNLKTIAIWTGDIFVRKESGRRFYVLTPRCDLANKGSVELQEFQVLICPVDNFTVSDYPAIQDSSTVTEKQKKAIDRAVVHHPIHGISTRFIPKSPFLPAGGRVNFSLPQTMGYSQFAELHEYVVTLSDDFVNEIAARFGAYLMRPGIVEVNIDELIMLKHSNE